MSATEVPSTSRDAAVGKVDMHLEVEIIPVSDVDRSKEFYQRLGWRLDDDVDPLDGLRIVQFTPPGSGASVTFGTGLTTAAPGSTQGGLIVSDIEAAHDELAGRGIDASQIWHGPPFPPEARQPGPDPERTSYGSFFSFNDPDGNAWLVQEVTTRLPGRITADTAYASMADLVSALQRAEAAYVDHQKRTGRSHLFTGQARTRTGPPGTPPTWWRSRPGRTCQRDQFRVRPRVSRVKRPDSHGRRNRKNDH
jgi:catechol 2,3-dioxygenase-like lactoylglutathione lyase family enzyme